MTDHERICHLAGQALALSGEARAARSLVGTLERLHAATDAVLDRPAGRRLRAEVRDALAAARRAPSRPASAMQDRVRRVQRLSTV